MYSFSHVYSDLLTYSFSCSITPSKEQQGSSVSWHSPHGERHSSFSPWKGKWACSRISSSVSFRAHLDGAVLDWPPPAARSHLNGHCTCLHPWCLLPGTLSPFEPGRKRLPVPLDLLGEHFPNFTRSQWVLKIHRLRFSFLQIHCPSQKCKKICLCFLEDCSENWPHFHIIILNNTETSQQHLRRRELKTRTKDRSNNKSCVRHWPPVME